MKHYRETSLDSCCFFFASFSKIREDIAHFRRLQDLIMQLLMTIHCMPKAMYLPVLGCVIDMYVYLFRLIESSPLLHFPHVRRLRLSYIHVGGCVML